MPIIKSAIKAMRQSQTRRVRNSHYGNHMKSMIKLVLGYVQKGEMEKAKKMLPKVIKSIDMAVKKGVIHKNNGANKKSRVQRAVNVGPIKKEEKAMRAPKVEKEAKAVKQPKPKETTEKPEASEKKSVKKSTAKKEKKA